MRYDVQITVSDLAPASGEVLFDALADALPESDPVATHDTSTGTWVVSLRHEAQDAQSAIRIATARFRAVASHIGIDLAGFRANVPQAA